MGQAYFYQAFFQNRTIEKIKVFPGPALMCFKPISVRLIQPPSVEEHLSGTGNNGTLTKCIWIKLYSQYRAIEKIKFFQALHCTDVFQANILSSMYVCKMVYD